MIWSEIRAEILRQLKEPRTDIGHWSFAELLRRANVVQRRICADTECLRMTTSTIGVAGQQEYPKPPGCIRISRVLYGQTRVFGINLSELDMLSESGAIDSPWQTVQDTPARYYEQRSVIGLVPVPNDSGTTISLECVTSPSDMVNDGDIPYSSSADLYHAHDLIINGVCYRCMLEDERPVYSEYKKEYDAGVLKLRTEIKNLQDTLTDSVMLRRRASGLRQPLDFWRYR